QVATWWEESRRKFWFAVVDPLARERIAVVVFEEAASVTLEEMVWEDASVMAAVRSLAAEGEDAA
ncbi:MAG TPA: hypothetical protein VI997_05270, partial [Candidatus Thermoplasmatota archaeon]|nr:hypothetical protein [Candidatus Thermoplasmatota archaeon]